MKPQGREAAVRFSSQNKLLLSSAPALLRHEPGNAGSPLAWGTHGGSLENLPWSPGIPDMGVGTWCGVHCVMLPPAGLVTQLLSQCQSWGLGTCQRLDRRTHLWGLGMKFEELGQKWGPLGCINCSQRTELGSPAQAAKELGRHLRALLGSPWHTASFSAHLCPLPSCSLIGCFLL